MTHINGTLTNDAAVPFDRWKATAHRVVDGAVVGATYITTSGTTPANYSINCGVETGACLVTATPAIGRAWSAAAPVGAGALMVPTDPATPYVYEATSVPATSDPLDASVVFYAHLDEDFTDSKGLSITVDSLTEIVGDKPYGTADGSGSALFTGDTTSGTSGLSVQDAALVLGTSDFCLELWFKCVPVEGDDPNSGREVIRLHDADNVNRIYVQSYPSGWASVLIDDSSGNILDSGFDGSRDSWQHVAISWASGFITVYVNGQPSGSATDMTWATLNFAMDRLAVGHGASPGLLRFNGNICRVRLTVGDARYTGAFTPPAIFSGTPAVTGATEPTWPTTVSATVTDGDVTWTNVGRMVQPMTHGWLLPG